MPSYISVGCNADERLLAGMYVAVRISIAVYNYSNKLVRRDTGCLRRTEMTASTTSRQANYSLSGMRWLVRRKGHGTTNHAMRAVRVVEHKQTHSSAVPRRFSSN